MTNYFDDLLRQLSSTQELLWKQSSENTGEVQLLSLRLFFVADKPHLNKRLKFLVYIKPKALILRGFGKRFVFGIGALLVTVCS